MSYPEFDNFEQTTHSRIITPIAVLGGLVLGEAINKSLKPNIAIRVGFDIALAEAAYGLGKIIDDYIG